MPHEALTEPKKVWLFIVNGEPVDVYANEMAGYKEYYRATQADKNNTNKYTLKAMYLNE